MIKRTIEISTGPTHLSIRNDQLVIRQDAEVVGTVPCEDIGVLIVDQIAVTYTHAVLTTLMRFGAVIIACGGDHHPIGMAWPLEANTLHTERLRLQVEMARPRGKRVWQQVVQAKIRAQAALLGKDNASHRKLISLAESVASGDTSNVEAQAAKIYWAALFTSPPAKEMTSASPLTKGVFETASPLGKGGLQGGRFHRDPDGPPPNSLLNYGYMALRAAVARAICTAGLHPSIGFHHRNRYNAFCLADDLMEPFRPLVDARVVRLWQQGKSDIDKETKAELLGVLAETVRLGEETGPLMVALARMMASLLRVLEGGERKLEIPTPCF